MAIALSLTQLTLNLLQNAGTRLGFDSGMVNYLEKSILRSFFPSLTDSNVPQRTSRYSDLFYLPPSTYNYLAGDPIRRLLTLANVDTSLFNE